MLSAHRVAVPNESKGPYGINILPPSPLLQTDYRDLFVPEHTLLCQTTTVQFQIREPLYVVQGHCYQFRSKWLVMADMGQYISASIGDLNSQLHGHPFNVNTALMYLLLSYNLLIVWLDGKHTLQVFRREFQFISEAMAEQQLQTYLNQSRLSIRETAIYYYQRDVTLKVSFSTSFQSKLYVCDHSSTSGSLSTIKGELLFYHLMIEDP